MTHIVELSASTSSVQGVTKVALSYRMSVEGIEEKSIVLCFEKSDSGYVYTDDPDRLTSVLLYLYKQKLESGQEQEQEQGFVVGNVLTLEDTAYLPKDEALNLTCKIRVESAEHMQGTLVSVTAEAVSSGEDVAA